MTRVSMVATLALALLAAPLAAEAQQAGKVYRIGVLSGASSPNPADHQPFLKALRELGYVHGQNLTLDERYGAGHERLPALAAELAGLNVDVIVTIGTPAARAAKAATATIPIVFVVEGDPVARRLVTSWARPGGNVTGLAGSPRELYEKRWQLLKDAVPRASRLAYLWDANYEPVSASTWVSEFAMPRFRTLELQVQFLEVKGPGDFMVAFERATKERADILFIDISPMTDRHFPELADLAAKSRLPAIAGTRTFADAGLLMSYGVNLAALAERRAAFVDKILKGAKPADLPVEQPTKFELVINLKTAKALGLTIPPVGAGASGRIIQ